MDNKEVRRRDPCVVCGNPVFLAQRLLVSGRLYHRTCFRCARCDSQLTTANCYETESGEYCCETCPDEEMDDIGDKGGGPDPAPPLYIAPPTPPPTHDIEKTDSLASARTASLVGLRRMMFENISQPKTDDDKELPRKLSLDDKENVLRKLSYNKGSVLRKSSLGDNPPRSVLIDKVSECEVPEDDTAGLKSSHRLSFKVRKSESESDHVDNIVPNPVSLKSDHFSPKIFVSHDSISVTTDVEEFSSLNTTTDSGIVETENFNINAQSKLDLDSDLEPNSNSSDVSMVQPKNEVRYLDDEIEYDKLIESKESLEKEVIEAKNDVLSNKSFEEESKSCSENEVLLSRGESESPKQLDTDLSKEEDEFTSLTHNIEKLVIDAKNEKVISAVEKEEASSNEVIDSEKSEEVKIVKESLPVPTPVERVKHKPPTPRSRRVKTPVEPKEEKKPVEDYPEELNPFGDDDEEEEEVKEKEKSSSSLNPFGSSDEEEEEVKKETETPKPTARKVVPAPKVNMNPFWSDDEEEEEEEVSLPPVPKPRKLKTPQPSPEPSPRLRRLRPATGSMGSSTSIASRKKKPAPLPPNWQPPNTPGSRKSYAAPRPPTTPSPPPLPLSSPPSSRPSSPPLWDKDPKQVYNRQRQNSITSETSSTGTASTFSNYTLHKSLSGQWRRKKGPAPPRPVPVRRNVAPMPLAAVRQELHDIEVKQQGLERQGVKLEQTIRDKFEQEGASLTPYVEEMVLQLFELVNEKNELFRRQAELMYLRRQHNLEEEHAELEYQIRCLMMRPERNKTDSDKAREEQLIQRLVEVVERRNEIIDCLEMDRLREKEEDKSVGTQLGIFSAAVGSQVDLRSPKSDKKEKKSKKEKRWSKREKDWEKEEESGEKKKSKKKWFTLHHLSRS